MVEKFVINNEEFEAFEKICNRDKYAYEYHVNSTEEYEEYVVVMNNDIRKALKIYIDKFDSDYEREVREANYDELVCISAHDWRIYNLAREIYNNVEGC